jgi:ketosteroid isomerase-like protein
MATPEEKIHSILRELQEGMAAKDLDALSSLIDDDIVLFGVAAASVDRRGAISYLAQMTANPGTVRWAWDRVLPIIDEPHLLVFAVVGTVGFDDSEGRSVGPRHAFRLTAVAVHRLGRWQLRHFHGSVPQTV